ncbi:MAG TPA: hypothetical protein VGD05_12640 [Pyrinomonadaceae bacterium]|jgi:hypothetical protein
MNDKETNEFANDDSTSDEEKVINKKSITAADVGSAFSDVSIKSAGESDSPVFKSIGVYILSLLLIISGVAIAIFTSLSVIGIVIGVMMIFAGIAIPVVKSRK